MAVFAITAFLIFSDGLINLAKKLGYGGKGSVYLKMEGRNMTKYVSSK